MMVRRSGLLCWARSRSFSARMRSMMATCFCFFTPKKHTTAVDDRGWVKHGFSRSFRLGLPAATIARLKEGRLALQKLGDFNSFEVLPTTGRSMRFSQGKKESQRGGEAPR
ncbi:unnamed protein product [Hapterophycus canaliculatus]